MAELLKNLYNDHFFTGCTQEIKKVFPKFNKKAYLDDVFSADWEDKELKQRMSQCAISLIKQLPKDFKLVVNILVDLCHNLEHNYTHQSLEYMFIPEIIEILGQNDIDLSLNAFEEINKFNSGEFAIRIFLINNQEKVMKRLYKWTNHKNHNVRRFATEACRPRLPWAMGVPDLKKDPSSIIPILENLKNDESLYVRRSVANNLNDISKDHPKLVIEIAKKWFGDNDQLNWVVKHGCRSLLKSGDQTIMALFGFGKINDIKITDFKINTPIVKIGAQLTFCYNLINESNQNLKLRLEYGIYYQKANGLLSRKVYKISEKDYAPKSINLIEKKQSFKIITTRKFHTGLHQLSIIINGNELNKLDFQLQNK